MKLTQTLIFGSVVLATTGMVSATPTPTEADSVISQAPRGLGVDEWVGEMIEAEIEELERLRLDVEGIVETEMPEEDVDGGSADIDIDEKDGEDGGEGDDEPEEPREPEEPKHPKHPKDDKHKHKHGKDKGEKKHKHKGDSHDHEHKHKHGKGDKHDHEHKHKHGKHHGGPPHGPPPHGPPPHGPPPHGPPHGGPHGGPPRHHPHGPPPPGGPPRHREGEHHDKAPRPPHRHHETDGPDDEDQMDDYFRVEDQEDENAVYNEDEDEDVQQPSEEPYDGERGPASQGPHRDHGHHHMDGMTGSGRGHHGPEHSRGFFHQLSASLTQFKPFEAMVLVITFTLGLISMMKTAIVLFFFAKRGGRGGKRGWMKHMGVREGGRHGPGHKRGMGRGGRGGRKSGSGSSGGSGSEDEGANLLVVIDEKYRDEKA